MRTPDELESSFEFIFDEFARYARMSPAELMAVVRDIAFNEIVDWRGRRRPIGAKAAALLSALAEEALAASAFHRRVAPRRAVESAFKLVGQRYFNPDRKSYDGAEIAEDLNQAIAEAAGDCVSRTHYIPCAIHVPQNGELTFGPVTIRPTVEVLESLATDVEAFVSGDEDKREHVQSVVAYYNAFPDIAVVVVDGCDGPTSKAVAEQAVQAALDALHVLAGAAYSRRMRAGGPALNNDRRGEISKSVAGLDVIFSAFSSGGANLADSWWQELRKERADLATAIGEPIWALVQCRDAELLGARFLEAATWYGDAARDPSSAAAVVKYLTAMERLLWAGDKMGQVTARISERAAALCFSTVTWNFTEVEAEVRTAYGIRSEIVHGRVSPSDPRVLRSARLCERVAHDLLNTWLERFGPAFGRPVQLDQLRAYFDGFVTEARGAAERARSPGETRDQRDILSSQ